MTLATLAAAFQVSRQGAALLVRKHGYAIVADPDALWLALLENGNASPLRSRLSDPRFRQAAADQLAIGRRYNRMKKPPHSRPGNTGNREGQNVPRGSTDTQSDDHPKPTAADQLAIGRRYNRIKKPPGSNLPCEGLKGQNVTLDPPKPTTAEALA